MVVVNIREFNLACPVVVVFSYFCMIEKVENKRENIVEYYQ